MDPTRLFTLTATITHVESDPDDPDEYGNPGTIETEITAACELQQVTRLEGSVDSGRQAEDWVVFVDPMGEDEGGYLIEVELEGSDRVEIDGRTYELIGPPWPVRNPRTGVVTHIEAQARRVI